MAQPPAREVVASTAPERPARRAGPWGDAPAARSARDTGIGPLSGDLGFAVRTWVGLSALGFASNIGAAAVIAGLIAAVNNTRSEHDQRVVIIAALTYLVVGTVLTATVAATIRRRSLRWVVAGRVPTQAEAGRTLGLPRLMAAVAGVYWYGGALVIAIAEVAVGGTARAITGICGGVIVSGLACAGLTYLLVERASRPARLLALEVWPPRVVPALALRHRLMLIWLLTSGTPVIGLILILSAPGPRPLVISAAITAAAAALAVGALSTYLAARSIGAPLTHLVGVLGRVGEGNLQQSVWVTDDAELGLLQNQVNEMVGGLRERDRISDLFGRHVGREVAQEALRNGVTLSGEVRDVVALFVDITGSTRMTSRTDPVEFVGILNRFFEIVVDEVQSNGGLVNKFEGDAALAVFGAPMQLIDPAGAALRAARHIRDRVDRTGEVSVGIGVAFGPVVAGQVGARSRLEFTVIGDAVNEAARLTDLAKSTPRNLLASGPTISGASDVERQYWTCTGETVLRGRDQPTELWTA